VSCGTGKVSGRTRSHDPRTTHKIDGCRRIPTVAVHKYVARLRREAAHEPTTTRQRRGCHPLQSATYTLSCTAPSRRPCGGVWYRGTSSRSCAHRAKAHVEVVALTVDQARALLTAAAGNRFEALFILALKTGMRRGELLALRWEDVHLDKGVLQVRGTLRRTREGLRIGTPKTPASRRKVVLSPTSVAALERHRARQDEERQTVAESWQDLGLVFPNRL
jgi:integrase